MMEKKGRKTYFFTLGIALVLLCGSLSALSYTTNRPIQQHNDFNISLDKSCSLQPLSAGYRILLDENFTDGNMPPSGAWGNWELKQTNTNRTWFIDTTIPHTAPYCATINRSGCGNQILQDEWLITPSLDFSQYTDIFLDFYWYTIPYVTIWNRFIEFNISVSVDGGVNWTQIWSFNDVDIHFQDWTWYKSILPNGNPIDLSDYEGYTNVKIGFQYYSNRTDYEDFQEFSIDTILIYASDIPKFECSAGGPYDWWWSMQFNNWPNGVRFRGSVNYTGTPFPVQWLWDFGDGTTSMTPGFAIHFYKDVGTYNVTLTVKDYLSSPPRVAFDATTVRLFLIKPPEMELVMKKFSLGVSVDIENQAQYNASYLTWFMNLSWGPFQIFEKKVANGTIDNITAGAVQTIRSPLLFLGFGRINVIVTVQPENIPGVMKQYTGFKFGPLIFIPKGV